MELEDSFLSGLITYYGVNYAIVTFEVVLGARLFFLPTEEGLLEF